MKRRAQNMKTDFPKLALGTWLIGGDKEPDPHNDDQKDIATIQLAVENNVSLIDTAQNYANGRCEELIGLALQDYNRASYQILTKQNKLKLSYDQVIEGFHESLRRLKVDRIDYFLCHAPNPEQFDMRDFFRASNQLYKDGLIKYVGVSNFGPKMLQLAMDTSEQPIAVNQVCFSLADDDALSTGTYEFCVKNNVPMQAYRTLVALNENQAALHVLTDIARKKNLTVQQVALAYLNSYSGVSFTIRAGSSEHWDAIKKALLVTLSDDEAARLRESHHNRRGASHHFLTK